MVVSRARIIHRIDNSVHILLARLGRAKYKVGAMAVKRNSGLRTHSRKHQLQCLLGISRGTILSRVSASLSLSLSSPWRSNCREKSAREYAGNSVQSMLERMVDNGRKLLNVDLFSVFLFLFSVTSECRKCDESLWIERVLIGIHI